MRQDLYKPGQQTASRKEQFRTLNQFIFDRGGWVTSIPGEAELRFECLPGSTVAAELRDVGHDVRDDGEGERLICDVIVRVVQYRFRMG
ncbi:hypothetical protein [Bradyrhizobium sp. Ai1a-2]|uniref:hypothetical protein n=1 Tax=Bradyrhizobium sp. Ai1a-2 TaxID=196490 RepID=UPI00041CC501|nr:hypothetical protein [Bradyrhizobium sp. Ai1a-2]